MLKCAVLLLKSASHWAMEYSSTFSFAILAAMYKGIVILYLVCFSLYIIYSREPDFVDGEVSLATIHWLQDSASQQKIPKAVFVLNKKTYDVDARYVLRNLPEGKSVQVIYNPAKPIQAAVYSCWGYIITWGEILGSAILLIVLFQVAVAVTKNPTANALIEQLEHKIEKKRRYDD